MRMRRVKVDSLGCPGTEVRGLESREGADNTLTFPPHTSAMTGFLQMGRWPLPKQPVRQQRNSESRRERGEKTQNSGYFPGGRYISQRTEQSSA